MQFGTTNTERMRITSGGNVGIGTTSPQPYAGYTTVHIGSASSIGLIKLGTGTSLNGPEIFTNNTNDISFLSNDFDARLVIKGSNGNVLIGTTSDAGFKLDVNGTFRASGAATFSSSAAITGGLAVGTPTQFASSIFFASAVLSAGAGTYPLKWNSSTGIVTYDTSSRLVKENIQDSPYGLHEVLQLQPRKYFRTDDQKEEIGFIADEVQTILPEFVPMVKKSLFTKNEEDTELIAGGVNYEKLTAVLVKAIKELKAEIDILKNN
jgi:hypothetical protein